MPNYVLCLCRIIVHVDVGLRYPDASKTNRKASTNDFHPVGACVASYIYSTTRCVGSCSTAPPGFVPCRRSVCTVQYKRDACPLPSCVQFVECVLCHLLHRAGGRTAFEFTLREIPSRLHVLRELGVRYVCECLLARRDRGLR